MKKNIKIIINDLGYVSNKVGNIIARSLCGEDARCYDSLYSMYKAQGYSLTDNLGHNLYGDLSIWKVLMVDWDIIVNTDFVSNMKKFHCYEINEKHEIRFFTPDEEYIILSKLIEERCIPLFEKDVFSKSVRYLHQEIRGYDYSREKIRVYDIVYAILIHFPNGYYTYYIPIIPYEWEDGELIGSLKSTRDFELSLDKNREYVKNHEQK